jgi:hypothetical protein
LIQFEMQMSQITLNTTAACHLFWNTVVPSSPCVMWTCGVSGLDSKQSIAMHIKNHMWLRLPWSLAPGRLGVAYGDAVPARYAPSEVFAD